MNLYKRFNKITITEALRFGFNAKLKILAATGIETEIDLTELAAINNLTATDLQKIDGVTNGTSAANKAVVLGASSDIDLVKFGAIGSSDASLGVDGLAAAQGGAIVVTGGTSSTTGNAGGAVSLVGGTPGATGVGGAASVVGKAGGATSGTGGAANLTAGAGTAGNANGGSAVITAGAANGSGRAGGIRHLGIIIRSQAAPTAKTVSATLTAAELMAGIVTINQGAGATSAIQLPTGAQIEAALPADLATSDSFDVSFMNISTVDAEDATVTTNTNLTLVGSMDFPAHSGITLPSQGVLRFRRTAADTFSVYRYA